MAEIIHYKRIGRFTGQCEFEFWIFFIFCSHPNVQLFHCVSLKFIQLTHEIYLQLYTKILNAFVASWFSLLSKNEDFVTELRHILREVTCRLVLKIKDVSNYLVISYFESVILKIYLHLILKKIIFDF